MIHSCVKFNNFEPNIWWLEPIWGKLVWHICLKNHMLHITAICVLQDDTWFILTCVKMIFSQIGSNHAMTRWRSTKLSKILLPCLTLYFQLYFYLNILSDTGLIDPHLVLGPQNKCVSHHVWVVITSVSCLGSIHPSLSKTKNESFSFISTFPTFFALLLSSSAVLSCFGILDRGITVVFYYTIIIKTIVAHWLQARVV